MGFSYLGHSCMATNLSFGSSDLSPSYLLIYLSNGLF